MRYNSELMKATHYMTSSPIQEHKTCDWESRLMGAPRNWIFTYCKRVAEVADPKLHVLCKGMTQPNKLIEKSLPMPPAWALVGCSSLVVIPVYEALGDSSWAFGDFPAGSSTFFEQAVSCSSSILPSCNFWTRSRRTFSRRSSWSRSSCSASWKAKSFAWW